MKPGRFFEKYGRIIVVIILFAITIPLSIRLTHDRAKYFPMNFDRPIGTQIMSEMLGEMRTVIASYIYIRADMYHHEREDKVDWRQDPATLPLYRLVTALDPHMVNAYDFGAYHLSVNLKKHDAALAFLREGLHYNPDSYQLHKTMGDIFYFKKDYKNAVKYLNESLNLTSNPIEVTTTLRELYWCYRWQKDYKSAGECVMMMTNMDPNNIVTRKLARELEELSSGRKTEADYRYKKGFKPYEDSDEKHDPCCGHNH